MEETLNIKCPNDGALLKVKYRPGLENMSITCPVCRQKMPFSKMIRMDNPEREEKKTIYPGMPQTQSETMTQYPQSMPQQPLPQQQMPSQSQQMQYPQNAQVQGCPPPIPNSGMNQTSQTHIPNIPNGMPGTIPQQGMQNSTPRLRSTQFSQVFPLRVGANIIGRKAANSSANIQLPASPLKRMSREHIKIEVRQVAPNQYQAICSLFKPDCNATYVNGMPLIYGNTFILQHGAILSLPDCEIVFEMY